MNSFDYTVSFRIEHPSMNPEDISAKLSLQPSVSWLVGTKKRSPRGRPLSGERKSTYWSCSLKHSPRLSLADFLETFTTRLERQQDFLKTIRSTGGRCEYFIGWFSDLNSGEVFSYLLLHRLSDLQIDLALDIYGAHSKRRTRTP